MLIFHIYIYIKWPELRSKVVHRLLLISYIISHAKTTNRLLYHRREKQANKTTNTLSFAIIWREGKKWWAWPHAQTNSSHKKNSQKVWHNVAFGTKNSSSPWMWRQLAIIHQDQLPLLGSFWKHVEVSRKAIWPGSTLQTSAHLQK